VTALSAPTALRAALRGRRVLLTGPVGPDGDSLGACLAFGWWLRGDGVDVTLAGRVPRRYRGLVPDGAFVDDGALAGGFDAVVVLDGDRHRLTPPVHAAFEAAAVRAVVDHHGSTSGGEYTHAWLDPRAESTCTMVLGALRAAGVGVPADVAAWLYLGLVFDTGGFRHSNTTPDTHRAAAELLTAGFDHTVIHARVLAERTPGGLRAMGEILAGAAHHLDGRLCVGVAPYALHARHALVDGDLEGVVEALLFSEGTEAAALLIERADGSVKVSLRSRTDLDVCAVARALTPSGGGHPRASGATLPPGSLAPTVRRVHDLVRDALAAPRSPSSHHPEHPR
jgi:phosphoesterase RecJ-like protein